MNHDATVGSLAEEAAKLLAAAEAWARDKAGGLRDTDHLATGSPPCTVCPLCQLVGAARSVRPDAVEHLLDAAASLVAALRSTVAVPDEPARSGERGVQRIDIREG